MKKLFGFVLCALLLPVVFTFTGCGGVDLYMYMYAGKYEAISSGDTFDNVKDIDIDWITGNLTIKSGAVEKVTITENGDNAGSKPAYYRQFKNGLMDIKYFKSGETRDTSIMKDLVITIPEDTVLKGIEINAPMANVNIIGVECNDIKITTSSGDTVVTGSGFTTAKVVAGSGDITFTSCSVDYTLTLNPNTGNVLVENCDVLDYTVYTFSGIITIKLDDESFLLDWNTNLGGICNYEDAFGTLTDDGEGGLVYGDVAEILHKISFEATSDNGTLNLLKNGGQ